MGTAAPLAAGVLAGLATALLLHRPAGDRLVAVVPVRPARPTRGGDSTRRFTRQGVRSPGPRRDARPRAACLVLAAACLLLLPTVPGLVAAVTAAVLGPRALERLEPAEARRHRVRLEADLPLLLDLLAACLAGGASLASAAASVASALPGPAGERLEAVAAALTVGTPPSEAWAALAGPAPDDDPLGPAARSLARAAEGGAPVAAAVNRLAADARLRARADGERAARRAGVLAVAPLGLCFLPAFVLLGVVPVVAGLAGPVLGGF